MYRSTVMAACVAAACFGGVESASAGTVLFTGTRFNVDAPGPQAARCGGRTTINIRPGPNSTSVGMSNFGAFVPVLSHCIQLPLPAPFDLGEFNFDFGGGHTIFGTYEGAVGPVVQGVANINQTHVITGGTGKFLNASGGFASSGQLVFGKGPPRVEQSFRGFITAAGIPEPASWALMIAGFGMAGAGIRRRAARTVFA
jgi:hypothetical protein